MWCRPFHYSGCGLLLLRERTHTESRRSGVSNHLRRKAGETGRWFRWLCALRAIHDRIFRPNEARPIRVWQRRENEPGPLEPLGRRRPRPSYRSPGLGGSGMRQHEATVSFGGDNQGGIGLPGLLPACLGKCEIRAILFSVITAQCRPGAVSANQQPYHLGDQFA